MCFKMVSHSLDITAPAALLPIFSCLGERMEATENQCIVILPTPQVMGHRLQTPCGQLDFQPVTATQVCLR